MKTNTKYWLYPLVAVLGGVIFALICHFAIHMKMVYSVFYGILASGIAFLTIRGIIHGVQKDVTKAFWATTVWGVIACVLFLWLILNTSSAIQTFLVFAILTAVSCFIGFEVWGKKGEEYLLEVEKVESRKEKIARLAKEMKYKMNGDTPLLDEPLCRIDGVDYTPAEADKMGYGAVAANGIEYIKRYVKGE